MANPETYTGKDVTITLGLLGGAGPYPHSTYAISDFSITLNRGTVTQELTGETGDFTIAGALSAEGSLTACKLGIDSLGIMLESIIDGTPAKRVSIIGSVGAKGFGFDFEECQITGFEINVGDGSTISEGSVDFKVMKPSEIILVKDPLAGTTVQDHPVPP